MIIDKKIIKIQFKIDHLSVMHRAGLLLFIVLVLLFLWTILFFQPQSERISQTQQSIDSLEAQTLRITQKNEEILQHAKNHDLDLFLEKYKNVKREAELLDKKLASYQQPYVDVKMLSSLLYGLFHDLLNVHINSFSTTLVVSPTTTASATTAIPKRMQQALPDITYYALTIKGNYFPILSFLKRIEQLKWQIFWSKLTYEVSHYPEARAIVEFYTLQPKDTHSDQPENTSGVTL